MRGALVVVLAIAACGCGRWGFDATDDGDGGDGVVVTPDAPLPAGRWAQVSSGETTTCGITLEGELWCWGANYDATLGIAEWSPEMPTAPPTKIGDASDWTAVVALDDWQCGLRGAGTVFCWGQNHYRVLGVGTVDAAVVKPTAVDEGVRYLQIASGGSTTCAIRADHSLWCWGRNEHGKLGRGTATTFELSGQVGSETDWDAIGVGTDHVCGLRGARVYCWGGNSSGQLGDAHAGIDQQRPELVATGHPWRSLAVGANHTCALSSDGTTQCWGENWDGRVGNGDSWDVHAPATVAVPQLASISAGAFHTCGLTTTGALYCWGRGGRGVLPGILDTSTALTPLLIAAPPGTQQAIAGSDHTCVIDDAHHLFCGGMNQYGQVGTLPGNALAFQRADDRTDWQTIAAGYGHACGTTTNLYTYCWGEGDSGQVGDGAHLARQTPELAGANFTDFTMGYDTTVARRGNELWLWGYDVQGDQNFYEPTLMTSSIRDVAQGSTHRCWSDLDGTLHCAGDNKAGQLGGGTYDYADTTIPGDWRAIYAGDHLSCATLVDGSVNPRLYCWGNGDLVGSVQADNQLSPVRTDLPDVPVLDVQFGEYFACALLRGAAKNEVWCWGDNDDGQLGDNTGESRPEPAPIDSALSFTELDLGDYHACAVTDSHQLWCWGYAYLGQAGSIAWNHPAPEQIPGTTWSDVAAGRDFTCALRTDGTRWCAGVNSDGELGNGRAWTTDFVFVP